MWWAWLVLMGCGAPDAEAPALRPSERLKQTLQIQPPPTENWLGEGAEQRNKQRRKAWFKTIHKAPPGIDYKAVERANGLAQLDKRRIRALQRHDDHGLNWVERGSQNQAGRMHVATHSSDGQWLVAGSSKGGLWRGNLEGTEWTPLGDGLYGGAHWLETTRNPTEGEPDLLLAATDNGLVHWSGNDGLTWQAPSGMADQDEIRRMIQSSDDAETVYVLGQKNGLPRLFRSDDGGRSFSRLRELTLAGDVWLSRTGDATLWLVDDGQLWRSDDRGDSFTAVGALPEGTRSARLAGSEAGAPTFYLVAQIGGAYQVFRSDDAGASWVDVEHTASDYWGSLNASITDPSRFAYGGVEVWRTRDGGGSFDKVNGWGDYYDRPHDRLHADIPGIDVVASGEDEVWYINTDGGLFRSLDALETVENLSLDGLRVSQYYDTHTSAANPEHVHAGAQDQGFQSTAPMQQSDDLYYFDQILSGDYAHLESGDGTHDIVYSVYPGFVLVTLGEDSPYPAAYLDYPSTEFTAWLPPIVADPEDPEALFFASESLYRYSYKPRQGTWKPTKWSEQDFSVLARDEYLSGLSFSPVDPQRVYATTSYGRLLYSEDKGVTWGEAEEIGPWAQYFYGTEVTASRFDLDRAWVAGSGYGQVPTVFETTDGGRSWHAMDEGIGDTLAYTLCEAPDNTGRLYVGTETTVYEYDPEQELWEDVTGIDAPVTSYMSCEVLPHENTIRFGTYGRGIWDLQLDPEGTGCYPVQDFDGDGHLCDVDCDDHNPTVFPGAADDCDGVDSDCDGTEETDGDGDGVLTCDGDCDDGDATVYPDADDPRNDDVDRDCDGRDQPAKACGCASGGSAGLWWVAVVGLALRRRRR